MDLVHLTSKLFELGLHVRDKIDTINLTSVKSVNDIAAEKLDGKWVIYNKRLVESMCKLPEASKQQPSQPASVRYEND